MTSIHYNVIAIVFGTLIVHGTALPKESQSQKQASSLKTEDVPHVQLGVSDDGNPELQGQFSEPESAPASPYGNKLMRRVEREAEEADPHVTTKPGVASLADTSESQTGMSSQRAAQSSRAAPSEVEQVGEVSVAAPAETSSEATKLEDLTEECMHTNPTLECEEKFGSYGARHMFTESYVAIKSLGYMRQGWMSHPAVQAKKFFDLTLPGSANSGTYASESREDGYAADALSTTQNLDLYKQLELGVRAFDIRIGYSPKTQLIHVSSGGGSTPGTLLIPVATLMRDIRRFLEENMREVVVIDVKKDTTLPPEDLAVLEAEETNNERVPGQTVHDAIQCELKEKLGIYTTLSQLPNHELNENPTIGELTDVGVQVIYFYEGQQVLCTSYEECKKTPGWARSAAANARYPSGLAFGRPYMVGERKNQGFQSLTGNRTAIEPACIAHSHWYTEDNNPEELHRKIKEFSEDLTGKTKSHMPTCYPQGEELPLPHRPSVWYMVEAYPTPTPVEASKEGEQMRGIKAIYTRGEGVTFRSNSERTNYLMLNWYLKKNNQPIFGQPNAIMFEFVSSAMMPIIRIIEMEQGRPECGWALYCMDSGSCWGDTLLGEDDYCISERAVERILEGHAMGGLNWNVYGFKNEYCIYITVGILSLCAMCGIVGLIQYAMRAYKIPIPGESMVEDAPEKTEEEEEKEEENQDGIFSSIFGSSAPAAATLEEEGEEEVAP